MFRLIILFILCLGPFCPDFRDGPVNAPAEAAVNSGEVSPLLTPVPETAGPFNGIGSPFIGAENDNGFCGEGFVEMNNGAGGLGWLSWPLESPAINDNRSFRIGHTGIDINGYVGQSVYAAANGRVVFAGWTSWGFGNLVVLSHGGNWFTFYAHMSSPKETLREIGIDCGADVQRGDLIGYVGQSGAATWPHLHFELRNGDLAYNPLPYLPPLQ